MPNITDGWAGRTNPATKSLSRFSPGFADVINDFQYQNPIDIVLRCEDTCTLNALVSFFIPRGPQVQGHRLTLTLLQAFGFAVRNCTSITEPYNLTVEEVKKAEDPFVLYVFNSEVSIVKDDDLDTKALYINTTRKLDVGLTGDREHKGCFLYPAVVNYTLDLDNEGTLSFHSFDWTDDKVVELLYVLHPCPILQGNPLPSVSTDSVRLKETKRT